MTSDPITILIGVYAAGVVIGLIFADAGPFTRVALALLWPVAIAAFVLTVAILIVVALIALPPRSA